MADEISELARTRKKKIVKITSTNMVRYIGGVNAVGGFSDVIL